MKCQIETCNKRSSKEHGDHHFCDACWKQKGKCCPVCGTACFQKKKKRKRKTHPPPTQIKTPRHVEPAVDIPAVPQAVPLAPAVVTNRTEATKTEWIEYDRVMHALRLADNTVDVDKQLMAMKKRIEKGRMQVKYALTNNTGRLIADVYFESARLVEKMHTE
jgi:hypothetical protein